MTKKRYTRYEVEGPPKGRLKRILLGAFVAVLLLLLIVAGGSYLWFRAQVSSANDRVAPEVLEVLEETPSTTSTTQPVGVATADKTATTTEEPSPSAMNLLVLGSDRRPGESAGSGRSDTLMIIHVDPDEDYLSVLSLPRDLRVDIPGYGKGKLNGAFAIDGPALTIKTIERTTGVDINHYMEVGFEAFTDIVDSLGGVYVDVDRRYFNVEGYFEPIDIQPGYQLLNGADALDYVRFRHDRNMDFGRMVRQQRFMSGFREQAMGWDLPFKLPGLISALFDNIATDLDANEILRLAKWGIGLSGDNIRTISLHGALSTINGAAYVVATEEQTARAVDRLLRKSAPEDADQEIDLGETVGPDGETGTSDSTDAGAEGSTTTLPDFSSANPPSTTATTAPVKIEGISLDIDGTGGRAGEAAAAAEWLKSLGATTVTVAGKDGDPRGRSVVQYPSGMSAEARQLAAAIGVDKVTRNSKSERLTLVIGEDFVLPAAFALPPGPEDVPDADMWRQWADQTPFAVEAPAYLPEGYSLAMHYPEEAATYDIDTGRGEKPAFRILYEAERNSDQMLGITGTTWLDAPAASEGLEVTYEGVVFTVVRNDTNVDRVWWKRDGVLYFVSNTLSHWLDQEEMLKMAESMIAIPRQ